MIRVSIDVSVQRTVQLKQFEPLVISATTNIALEGDESMPEIFTTEATLLRALVDAQLEPNLRQRMEQNTANDNTATNTPWPGDKQEYGEQEYDDLPFSDEDAPAWSRTRPPGPPDQGKPVFYGAKSQYTGRPYWMLWHPLHNKMCGAAEHRGMLQTSCKDEQDNYLNYNIPFAQAQAIWRQ